MPNIYVVLRTLLTFALGQGLQLGFNWMSAPSSARNMAKRKLVVDEVIDLTVDSTPKQNSLSHDDDNVNFNLLTYNIDGLNEDALDERWMGVRNIVLRESPDIIFFQEVTPYLFPKVLQLKAAGYICSDNAASCSALGHYFTIILVKQPWLTSTGSSANFSRMPYSGQAESLQGRNIACCRLKTSGGVDALLLNLHLESCGKALQSPESATRVAQLTAALQVVSRHSGPALCGGDLNLRNEEAAIALRDCSVMDAAEQLRVDRKKWNTWYCPGKPMVSCRFDRIYSNRANSLQPVSIKMVGDEEVVFDSVCQYRTPSDHRGLLVKYTTDVPLAPSNSASSTVQSIGTSSGAAASGDPKEERRRLMLEAYMKRNATS